jgi:hypothetical protein
LSNERATLNEVAHFKLNQKSDEKKSTDVNFINILCKPFLYEKQIAQLSLGMFQL